MVALLSSVTDGIHQLQKAVKLIHTEINDLKSSHQKDRASQQRFEDEADYGRKIQAREEQLNAYVQELKKYESSQNKPPPQKEAETRSNNEDLVKASLSFSIKAIL